VEIEILEKKDNKLLQRTELEFKVSHPEKVSPNRDSVRSAIAKLENANKELVIIDHMHTEYGIASIRGFAKIYKKKENALDLERRNILVRNGLIVEDTKAEKPKKEPKPKPEKEPEGKPVEKPEEGEKGKKKVDKEEGEAQTDKPKAEKPKKGKKKEDEDEKGKAKKSEAKGEKGSDAPKK
jgi:small subunit ribosomal protein S24e